MGEAYQPLIPRPAPSAGEVVMMVDETAKSVMRQLGISPERWDELHKSDQDKLRLQALDRLRGLA